MLPESNLIRTKYIWVLSLFSGLLLSLVPIMFAIDAFRSPDFYLRIIDVVLLYLLVSAMFFVGIWINLKWYQTSVLKKIVLNTGFYVLFTFLCIAIHFPIWRITSHIPIHFYIKDEIIRNLTIVLVSLFLVRFYVKISENQQLKEDYADLQTQHLNSQLTALMNQINPHFFFNTLNTLSGLIQENPEKSEKFIDKLSQVFRYILNMQENSHVHISEEMKFARDYAFLLNVRFDDKLKIDFSNVDQINARVPSLCSQLLIENVIKHNRMNQQFPLIISFSEENDCLRICNNLNLLPCEDSTGLGLKNLNRRSELLSGKPIVVEKTEDMFCVKVPLIKI
ncbi:MAG: histidine kinase [Prolixibacteraceae bacterium]|nr:histidine kinase [Prolixibacteraceae bacterium]